VSPSPEQPDLAEATADAAATAGNAPDQESASDQPGEQAATPEPSETASSETADGVPPSPEQEIAELRDRVLRTQAELENTRKRTARELHDQRKFAAAPVMTDMLSVLDNIRRAIEAAEKTGNAPDLLSGFQMVEKQMLDTLAAHHCTRIEALGQPFDPHVHDAILQQPSADQPPGTVLMVTREGYKLHERVLRPAQVIVAKGEE
jgi:molecular chaperone GrpE